MMNYKNYVAHVEFDDEAEIFHGEVINTRDVITFQGSTVKELKRAFVDSIEDYLAFCEERGEEPDRAFSGKFNLRLDPDLHRKAFIFAKNSGKSLNDWVKDTIQHFLLTEEKYLYTSDQPKRKPTRLRVSDTIQHYKPISQPARRVAKSKKKE